MKIEYNKVSQINRLITESIDRKRFQSVQGNQNTKSELDETSFSKEGQFLAKVMQKLQTSSDIRSVKVDELRKQIESGTYQYNFEEIAKKMSILLDWD